MQAKGRERVVFCGETYETADHARSQATNQKVQFLYLYANGKQWLKAKVVVSDELNQPNTGSGNTWHSTI